MHDASPLNWRECDVILRDLRGVGVGVVSLLVVPDHHGLGRMSGDGEFREWLVRRVGEGHEAVLHGWRHLREPRGDEGWWTRVVTERYTAGEGEFHDLDEGEARRRLAMGKAEFAACGLEARGFVAPAWLLGVGAERAVRAEGFDYTTRIGGVWDYRRGRVVRARSLVWSVRAGWRRVCSLLWNRVLFGALGGAPLVRVGIHPPDWRYGAVRRQVLGLSGGALAGRRAMTYEGWLESQVPA